MRGYCLPSALAWSCDRHGAALTCLLRQNQNPLILCVVDASTNLFHQSLLVQGAAGGRQVAQRLTHGIAEYLSLENVQAFQRLSFWIIFFYNRRTVLDALLGNAVCTAEQFDAFLTGFSQTSPRFQIVEVGPGRDTIDEKIKGKRDCEPLQRRLALTALALGQNTSKRSPASHRRFVCSSPVSRRAAKAVYSSDGHLGIRWAERRIPADIDGTPK